MSCKNLLRRAHALQPLLNSQCTCTVHATARIERKANSRMRCVQWAQMQRRPAISNVSEALHSEALFRVSVERRRFSELRVQVSSDSKPESSRAFYRHSESPSHRVGVWSICRAFQVDTASSAHIIREMGNVIWSLVSPRVFSCRPAPNHKHSHSRRHSSPAFSSSLVTHRS